MILFLFTHFTQNIKCFVRVFFNGSLLDEDSRHVGATNFWLMILWNTEMCHRKYTWPVYISSRYVFGFDHMSQIEMWRQWWSKSLVALFRWLIVPVIYFELYKLRLLKLWLAYVNTRFKLIAFNHSCHLWDSGQKRRNKKRENLFWLLSLDSSGIAPCGLLAEFLFLWGAKVVARWTFRSDKVYGLFPPQRATSPRRAVIQYVPPLLSEVRERYALGCDDFPRCHLFVKRVLCGRFVGYSKGSLSTMYSSRAFSTKLCEAVPLISTLISWLVCFAIALRRNPIEMYSVRYVR